MVLMLNSKCYIHYHLKADYFKLKIYTIEPETLKRTKQKVIANEERKKIKWYH